MSTNIPTHIAIIPDGNRRWASEHGKTPVEGHTQGSEVMKIIMPHALEAGVRYISVWGMSLDNFTKRSLTEVAGLLALFRKEFRDLAVSETIHSNKVKINVIGRWKEKFPSPVRSSVQKAIDATAHYTDNYLNIFLAYDGIDEMTQAIEALVKEGVQKITREVVKQHLFTKDLPSVDLIVRTGGEPHLSAGFMMWDVTDSQLWFTEKLWPTFTSEDLDEAIAQYGQRQRRKGA
jgi:undecaprenyl diphosphate synthase